jgi:exonuclease SbcD
MRFIHMADTHLGYSAYNRIDPETGRNQREMDIENAFRQAVDIVLEKKPDFVIHAGDLFHTVRPTNRALSFAMEEISRITEEGIPFIIIAGNHSNPRMRETGSVFRIISRIKGVRAFIGKNMKNSRWVM